MAGSLITALKVATVGFLTPSTGWGTHHRPFHRSPLSTFPNPPAPPVATPQFEPMRRASSLSLHFDPNSAPDSNPDEDCAGFTLMPKLIPQETIKASQQSFERESRQDPARFKRNSHMTCFDHYSPTAERLANNPILLNKLQGYLQQKPILFRCTLIDKDPHSSWKTSWHQDWPERFLISGLKHRQLLDVDQLAALEEVVKHRKSAVEKGIITVHIHLDESDQQSGCLKMVKGSHRYGDLTKEEQNQLIEAGPVISCEANAGDVVIMNPKILHSSEENLSNHHRRILHLEFVGEELLYEDS